MRPVGGAPGDGARPVLVYDGDCGLCTRAAGFAASGWPAGGPDPGPVAVPWQSLGEAGLAGLGLTVGDARAAAWWVDGGGRRHRGHRAVGEALLAAGRGWRPVAGRVVLAPPGSWVAAAVYRVVARNRHRLPVSSCSPVGSGRSARR